MSDRSPATTRSALGISPPLVVKPPIAAITTGFAVAVVAVAGGGVFGFVADGTVAGEVALGATDAMAFPGVAEVLLGLAVAGSVLLTGFATAGLERVGTAVDFGFVDFGDALRLLPPK